MKPAKIVARSPQAPAPNRGGWRVVGAVICATMFCAGTGCVTKHKAEVQCAAYLEAEQHQALLSRPVVQGSAVSFVGPVRNPTISWMPGLTLAQAIVSAGFTGAKDPQLILIKRQNEEIPVNPQHLLGGQDIPLVMGDVIEIHWSFACCASACLQKTFTRMFRKRFRSVPSGKTPRRRSPRFNP